MRDFLRELRQDVANAEIVLQTESQREAALRASPELAPGKFVIDPEIGTIATAIGVFVAAWQVRRNTRQSITNFEDDLSREYRTLIRGLSVNAQLGLDVTEEELKDDFSILVHYIDLSNEQVFLRQSGRVSRVTWENWRVGIRENLKKPAFASAWQQVKNMTEGSFEELKRLEAERFASDPRSWLSTGTRFRRWLTAG